MINNFKKGFISMWPTSEDFGVLAAILLLISIAPLTIDAVIYICSIMGR